MVLPVDSGVKKEPNASRSWYASGEDALSIGAQKRTIGHHRGLPDRIRSSPRP